MPGVTSPIGWHYDQAMADFDQMLKLAETSVGSIDPLLAKALRGFERVPALPAVN
jgi:hypothetical protein